MDFKDLSPELRKKVEACKTPEELLALAAEEGYELTDEDLKAINGGTLYADCTWDDCKEVDCKLCKGLAR